MRMRMLAGAAAIAALVFAATPSHALEIKTVRPLPMREQF